jgi:hypothetical protein
MLHMPYAIFHMAYEQTSRGRLSVPIHIAHAAARRVLALSRSGMSLAAIRNELRRPDRRADLFHP